jgi:predicted 2-oxoglutarate/Fe(II)-dependent dioxygenase YbiX|tara:strand:+ start:1298 stop:1897 length:600 start_codon:yes stop_codon:yes gene_type:complete
MGEKIMEINNFIYEKENFLPLKALSSLIKWTNTQSDKFKKGGLISTDISNNNVIDESYRRVENFSLSRNSKLKTEIHWVNFLSNYFKNLCLEYQEKLNTSCELTQFNEITILKYQNQGHYKFHTDHCLQQPRTLSIIYLLNNDYEGGDLVFSTPGKEQETLNIEKKPNKVIIWPSNFMYPHKVTPVTKGLRYSIVSWAV